MTTQPSDWAVALPCPFCGETPHVGPEHPEIRGNAWGFVECQNDACPAQPRVQDGEDIADDRGSDAYKQCAIKRWNRRAPVARELDASGGAVPMDKGPWQADDDGKRVHSEDFAVDAMLTIGGDFIDDHHRKDYAVWLARTLNGATPRAAEAGDLAKVKALPAAWRMRAERKRIMGLASEARLDEVHALELEAAMGAVGAGD